MTMRTVLTHLWKEWREQRWILLAIAAAIPLLTAGGGWALRLGPLDWGRLAPAHLAGSTALVVLALSTELFAAEGRRDGFAFLRRTPGALRVAWGTKTSLYLLACAAVFLWAALVLFQVATWFGGSAARDEVLLAFADPLVAGLTGMVVGTGLWILMASTWISRGAAAAGAALLLLAMLGAPVYLALRAQPAFLPSATTVRWVAVGLVALALAASAYGFLRGMRFARHPWSAAWRGLALVLVVAAPAYAYGAQSFHRWLDLWPQQHDVHVESVWVSHEGRNAYMNVYRPGDSRRQKQGAVTRPFRIDLASGEAFPMGPLGSHAEVPYDVWASSGVIVRRGTVGLVQTRARVDEEKRSSLTWWDAVRGVALKTLPSDVRTPDVIELERTEMRRVTPNQLPDGRPVWILARSMEHDGLDGRVVSVPLPQGLGTNFPMNGGWYGYAAGGNRFVTADAEGRPVVAPRNTKDWEGSGVFLDPDTFVGRRLRTATRRDPQAWHLVTASTGEAVPAAGLTLEDTPLAALSGNRLLVHRRDSRAGTGEFWVVDPSDGGTSRVPTPPGAPERPGVVFVGTRTPGGALVIGLNDRGTHGHVLGDPVTGALRAWTPGPANGGGGHVIACIDEETAIFLSDLRRLVRVRWGSAEREVLFPR
jgi:hypothetical protein